MLAGALLGRLGFAPTFLTAAAFGITAWLLLIRLPLTGATAARRPWRETAAAVRAIGGDTRILITSLAQAGQFMLHGLLTAFLPVYAVDRVGLTPAQAGLLFGAQMVTTILARPVFGRLSDRAGRRPMIVAGLVTCAVAVALFAWCTGFVSMLLVAALYGAGLAITTSSTAALITDLADKTRYGAAHGLFGTIFDVGDALGPIAGGFVAARFGYHTLFQSAAGLALLLALVFGTASRSWSVDGRR